jgi:hypothetical protein
MVLLREYIANPIYCISEDHGKHAVVLISIIWIGLESSKGVMMVFFKFNIGI